MLAFGALWYSQALLGFLQMNLWIQWVFVLVFFGLGLALLFNYKLPKTNNLIPKLPPLGLGAFLAFANPPVLFYWILGISLLQPLFPALSDMGPMNLLLAFFVGVFIGKVAVLYGYARYTRKLSQRRSSGQLQRLVGLVLIGISVAQGLRWAIS